VHDSLDRLTARWATVTLTYGVLLVLAGTLFPYDFVFEENGSTFGGHFRFLGVGKPADFLANVLLFLPLGFALTCLAQKRGLTRRAELIVVIAAGASLSFCVELSQVFLPSRFVSFVDVVSNTVGTVLGCLIFRFWGPQVLNYASTLVERTNGFLTINVVTASFVGYAVLTFLISIALQQATSLTNWDDAFPLLLGNERTGNRPWRGRVYQLQIANRAISEEEVAQAFSEGGPFASIDGPLLGSYQLQEGGIYYSQSGHLSELVWKGQLPDGQDDKGRHLGGGSLVANNKSRNRADPGNPQDLSVYLEHNCRHRGHRAERTGPYYFAFRRSLSSQFYPWTRGESSGISASHSPHWRKWVGARTHCA